MALTDSLTAALEAQGLGWTLGGGKPDPLPGVVVWQSGPVDTPTSLSDVLGEQTTVYTLHCVGLTVASCLIAHEKAKAAVTSLFRQTIDGQVVSRMPLSEWPPAMTRDDDTDPPLYDLPAQWRIRTTPA